MLKTIIGIKTIEFKLEQDIKQYFQTKHLTDFITIIDTHLPLLTTLQTSNFGKTEEFSLNIWINSCSVSSSLCLKMKQISRNNRADPQQQRQQLTLVITVIYIA